MSNYLPIANEYFNTGGHYMVHVTTVIDQQTGQTLFVNISDEDMTVSTVDVVRSDLPGNIDALKFVKYSLDCADWTHDPAPDNSAMNDLPEELVDLLDDCLLQFIKTKVAHSHRNYFSHPAQLPNKLYSQLPDGYEKWLVENDLMAETDGEKIIVDNAFLSSLYDVNGLEALKLKDGLDEAMRFNDHDDAEWDKFYAKDLQLIYDGKLYTFANSAAVYQALQQFVENILSEQ